MSVRHPDILRAVKPRIFISHSAKEPEALAVRDKLKKALKDTGRYTVLLDVDTIQPGDRWRCEINLWLGACDAAVVLLSEEALKSPYVTYETSVLAYRNVLDKTFLILPVLLGNVTEVGLQKSYLSAAQLDEIQIVRGTTPEEIVALVLQRIESTKPGELTPVEKRAERLAKLLRGVSDEVLHKAGKEVALELPWMSSEGDLRLRLAVQLMSVEMEKASKAILAVRPDFPLAERSERIQKVVELVASSWVDLRCLDRIPKIAKGKEPRAFGINADYLNTAQMYLVCASQDDDDWYTASCNSICGEDKTELKRAIRASLLERLGSPTDEELKEDLKALNKSGQPVIVVLNGAGVTDDLLRWLSEEFQYVTFFLLMGHPAIKVGAPLSSSIVEMLVPHLIEGEEDYFRDQYDFLERSVRFRP